MTREVALATVPASETPRPAAATPSLWRIVADTYRGASSGDRKVLGFLLAMIGFQILVFWLTKKDHGRGGWEVADLVAICSAFLGIGLSGIASWLQLSGQRQALGEGTAGRPRALHAMLMATPTLNAIAVLLLGLGAGIAVARGLILGLNSFWTGFLYGLAGVGISVGVMVTTRFLYSHAREQAEQVTQVRAEVAEARMAALTSQLHPHYLFNALNTIAALVRTDPQAAETTVENVAQVLRRTLDRSGRATTPLAEEIDYVKAYLAVEKARWGDRLRVSYRIASEVLDLPVPPLVLQPLVENALKHGLSERLEGGAVEIAAEARDAKLVLTVTDDGLGLFAERRDGTGLTNLSQRLATLYGAAATVALEARPRGARATVTLPVSRA